MGSCDLDAKFLVGCRVPGFRAITSKGSLYFPGEIYGSWVILMGCAVAIAKTGAFDYGNREIGEITLTEIPIAESFNGPIKMFRLKQSEGTTGQNSRIACIIDPETIIRAIIDLPASISEDLQTVKVLINWISTNDHLPLKSSSRAVSAQTILSDRCKSSDEGVTTSIRKRKEDQACECFFCVSTEHL